MKKSRFAVLAAVMVSLGAGLPAPHWMPPAAPFAAVCEAASHIDESIRPIQLAVNSHRMIDADGQGELLRSSETMVVFTGSAASEGGAYGAALLAGVGLGWYRDAAEAVSVLKVEQIIEPDPANAALYARPRELYAKLYPALRDVFAFGAK